MMRKQVMHGFDVGRCICMRREEKLGELSVTRSGTKVTITEVADCDVQISADFAY